MLNSLYYNLKPFIPRRLQIWVRRVIARHKLKKYSHIWPIDDRAGLPPEGWPGWPEGKKFALVLTHDVESAKGLEKVIELAKLEESLGFRSSFNFVAEDYEIPQEIFDYLKIHGFEIGIHGLKHDGNTFKSYRYFKKQVPKINEYLKKWGAVGFRAPSMYHNLNWVGELNIEYDSSTFDTDPFEPQPEGLCSIFPIWIPSNLTQKDQKNQTNHIDQNGFVEHPYTLPQDHTLFLILKERDLRIWKEKLDWIANKGGMALILTHPDYMSFNGNKTKITYPVEYYIEFLKYVKSTYSGVCWHKLPNEIARFYKNFILSRNNTYEVQTYLFRDAS